MRGDKEVECNDECQVSDLVITDGNRGRAKEKQSSRGVGKKRRKRRFSLETFTVTLGETCKWKCPGENYMVLRVGRVIWARDKDLEVKSIQLLLETMVPSCENRV